MLRGDDGVAVIRKNDHEEPIKKTFPGSPRLAAAQALKSSGNWRKTGRGPSSFTPPRGIAGSPM
jgi:hypothetical protein